MEMAVSKLFWTSFLDWWHPLDWYTLIKFAVLLWVVGYLVKLVSTQVTQWCGTASREPPTLPYRIPGTVLPQSQSNIVGLLTRCSHR